MSQEATQFLSQINAKLIFHLLNENYGDKMKTYPNFINIFKQKMGNIHATKSESLNLIEMNKILLSECSRLLNEPRYDKPNVAQGLNFANKSDEQAKKLFKERLDERVKEFKSFSEAELPPKLNFEVEPANPDDFSKSVKDLHAKMMSERSFDIHTITKEYNQKGAQEWINNEAPPLLKIDHASVAEVGTRRPPFPIKKVRFQEEQPSLQNFQHDVGSLQRATQRATQRTTQRIESMHPHVYNPNIELDAPPAPPPTTAMIRAEAAKALAGVKLELEAPVPVRAPTPPPPTPPPLTPQPETAVVEPGTSFLAKLKKQKPREPQNLCLRPSEINGNQMQFSFNFGNIKQLKICKLFLTNTHTKRENALEQTIVSSLGDEPFLVFSLDINGQEKLKNVLFIKKYNDDRTIYYETDQSISINEEIDNISLRLFDKDSNAMDVPSFLTIESQLSGSELHIDDQDQRDFAADKYTYLQFKEGMLSAGDKIVINESMVEVIGTCQIELNIDKYELEDVDYRNHHQHNYCIVEWADTAIQSVQHISRIPIVNFRTS